MSSLPTPASAAVEIVTGFGDTPATDVAPLALTPWQIVVRFLRFGLLAWGRPVAQIAMIRRELVDEERWLSSGRFNRLLVVYQVLPGPDSAAGRWAIAMRAGIFLPAFGFSLLLYDRLEQVVENRTLHGLLEGVAAGVVGLIAATTFELAGTLVQRLPSLWTGLLIFVAALAFLYLWKSKMNVVLAVFGAGLLGWPSPKSTWLRSRGNGSATAFQLWATWNAAVARIDNARRLR